MQADRLAAQGRRAFAAGSRDQGKHAAVAGVGLFAADQHRGGAAGPFDLPRGTGIVFTPLVTHHLPEMYPQPEKFLPDRWLTLRPSPYAYHPFGAGPRLCIGGPLATAIIRIALRQDSVALSAERRAGCRTSACTSSRRCSCRRTACRWKSMRPTDSSQQPDRRAIFTSWWSSTKRRRLSGTMQTTRGDSCCRRGGRAKPLRLDCSRDFGVAEHVARCVAQVGHDHVAPQRAFQREADLSPARGPTRGSRRRKRPGRARSMGSSMAAATNARAASVAKPWPQASRARQ